MEKIYDVIVIGGGPGGYTAALYAVRAGLSTIVIEKLSAGGQMASTTQIDNYPGFENGVDGFELGQKMQAQAERFGAETEYSEVREAKLTGEVKEIITNSGSFYGKSVIISSGASPKKTGLPGEEMLIGRGVGYCAACDGMFYRGKTVTVIGGGNSAAADALLLSRICKKVNIVHRRDALRATKVYHEPLMKAENIEFHWNSVPVEFVAENKVTGLKVRDVNTNEEKIIETDGVFVSIGRQPDTGIFKGQLELDENGYIIAGEDTKTNIPGVFAAGDVRTKTVRQIVTAAADGAIAAHGAEEYLAEN